jgi:hypothetical protein
MGLSISCPATIDPMVSLSTHTVDRLGDPAT